MAWRRCLLPLVPPDRLLFDASAVSLSDRVSREEQTSRLTFSFVPKQDALSGPARPFASVVAVQTLKDADSGTTTSWAGSSADRAQVGRQGQEGAAEGACQGHPGLFRVQPAGPPLMTHRHIPHTRGIHSHTHSHIQANVGWISLSESGIGPCPAPHLVLLEPSHPLRQASPGRPRPYRLPNPRSPWQPALADMNLSRYSQHQRAPESVIS